MRRRQSLLVVAASCVATLVGMAWAETKVELKSVHICCGACKKAVNTILEKSGVKGEADQDAGKITFTAENDKAAQKVLDAIAAGGFHGETGNKDLKIKDDSGAKDEKVPTLTVKGAHNCCPQCCKAIKAVVEKIEGVESEDAKPKGSSFTVKGNFNAAKLVKALNDAGFHVKVEK
jgi:copper chaperone CopZ